MRRKRWRRGFWAGALMALGALAPGAAAAQEACREEEARWLQETDEAINRAWARVYRPLPEATPDREAAYAALLQALLRAPEMQPLLHPDERSRRLLRDAAADKLPATQTQLNADIVKEQSLLARSVNATATNPRAVGLLERSGLIDLVALAVQGTGFLSADDTAVTLNLGAAGLLRGGRSQDFGSARNYQARGIWNRVGGSLTFGAKIPKKDLTGFSGLPDPDKLFDVVVWDVKLRVLGDRDPRARRWEDVMLGSLAALTRLEAKLIGFPDVPLDDARPGGALQRALGATVRPAAEAAQRWIARSWQASLKYAGQHLTEERGMNKYSASLLADGGLGPVDLTLNATFSRVQGVSMGAGAAPFSLKQWKAGAGLSGTIWKDRLISGRGSEFTLSGEAVFPVDGKDPPVARKRLWRADLAITFPVAKSAQIPFSVTFSNDPNNLQKTRFFRGQIGINYDFGSLQNLAKGGDGQP